MATRAAWCALLLLALMLLASPSLSLAGPDPVLLETEASLQADAAPASRPSPSPFHPPATAPARRAAHARAAAPGASQPSPAALAFEAASQARAASPTPAQLAFAAAQHDAAARSAASQARRPEAEVDSLLRQAILKTAADGLIAGETALREFCDECDETMYDSDTCASKRVSCRSMLCNPVCLSMAWSVELEVDCAAAPQWHACSHFAQQVSEAARAITSQFQAHVCRQAGLCSVEPGGAVAHWLDSHAYGNKYPLRMLPIDACMVDLAAHSPAVGRAACVSCQRVVRAKIRRGTCVPGFSGGFETKTTGALQQRCEFVADYISAHAHSLLLELQHAACSCLGCCDFGPDGALPALAARQCYFPPRDGAWLTDLVERVTSSVSGQIREQQRREEEQRQLHASEDDDVGVDPPQRLVDLRMEL